MKIVCQVLADIFTLLPFAVFDCFAWWNEQTNSNNDSMKEECVCQMLPIWCRALCTICGIVRNLVYFWLFEGTYKNTPFTFAAIVCTFTKKEKKYFMGLFFLYISWLYSTELWPFIAPSHYHFSFHVSQVKEFFDSRSIFTFMTNFHIIAWYSHESNTSCLTWQHYNW